MKNSETRHHIFELCKILEFFYVSVVLRYPKIRAHMKGLFCRDPPPFPKTPRGAHFARNVCPFCYFAHHIAHFAHFAIRVNKEHAYVFYISRSRMFYRWRPIQQPTTGSGHRQQSSNCTQQSSQMDPAQQWQLNPTAKLQKPFFKKNNSKGLTGLARHGKV